MKFLKVLFWSCALFAGISVQAQTSYSVKAVLVDATTGDPIGFATVSLSQSGRDQAYKYTLSDENGNVNLTSVARGEYTLKAELLGYQTYTAEIKVQNSSLDLGTIKLATDSEQLDAALVSAIGNQMIIKKDTIEYNATAFRTTDNDVLEDLLKKLPGVEVSDDGTITANGEEITKITIDGKTFFLDDPQLASKNIPAKMVNKLKVIQKKSEQAEFTGIDDGEEETIIDLSVQPGMMRGLFGNVLAGGGADLPSTDTESEFRYQGNAFIGRFNENSQISLILNGNNINSRGATNRAGNMMMDMRSSGIGGSGAGITTYYMAGINGAWDLFDDKMDFGGNYLFNRNENYVDQSSVKTTYLTDYNLIYNSSGVSETNTTGHRFGIRLEHKFSDNTSIIFQPEINFGRGNYIQASRDTTYNDDLAGTVSKLSRSYADNSGDNTSVTSNGFFLFRQRLGIPGRTISANVNYSISSNSLSGLNSNGTYTYDDNDIETASSIVNQSFDNRQESYSVNGRVTYTEPLGNRFYLEANYSYRWSRSESDKSTYDLDNGGEFDPTYSNRIINESNNQEIGVNALYQSQSLRAQLGFAAMPTKTYNETTRWNSETETYSPVYYEDFRWNFSPQVSMFVDFGELSSMRLFYRGTSSQPSTSQLIPVPDNSDPLNISFGNPSLVPYFTHSLRGDYRYSNREKYTSFNIRFNGNYVQNPIVNLIWYGSDGGQFSMPFNGPSSFNANVNTFANVPIGKSNFSFNNMLRASYSSSSSFVGSDIDMSTYYDESGGYYAFMEEVTDLFLNDANWYNSHITENSTRTLSINERLRVMYRGTALEATLGASTRVNRSWYSIATVQDNTTTWNNQLSGSITWNWSLTGISLDTGLDYNWYNGYSTEQPSECVLNAEISKLLFNNTVTLALRGYDILGQAKNITVTDNSNYHTESVNNTLGRYIIVSLTWRFGTMGGNRTNRGPGGGGPGGGPGGPPPGM